MFWERNSCLSQPKPTCEILNERGRVNESSLLKSSQYTLNLSCSLLDCINISWRVVSRIFWSYSSKIFNHYTWNIQHIWRAFAVRAFAHVTYTQTKCPKKDCATSHLFLFGWHIPLVICFVSDYNCSTFCVCLFNFLVSASYRRVGNGKS